MQPFLLHSEHTHLLAGQVKKPTVPMRFWPGLIGMIALSTVCMSLFLIPWVISGARLATNGATTSGRVIARRDDSTTYYVTYAYLALLPSGDSRRYTHEERVWREHYEAMPIGASVSVRYVADDPSTATATWTIFVQQFQIWASLIVLILAAGTGAFVLQHRREVRFVQHGQLLDGTLTSCDAKDDSEGDYEITLTYTFQSPSGQPLTKKESGTRNDLRTNALPVVGEPIKVLYLDDKDFFVL